MLTEVVWNNKLIVNRTLLTMIKTNMYYSQSFHLLPNVLKIDTKLCKGNIIAFSNSDKELMGKVIQG